MACLAMLLPFSFPRKYEAASNTWVPTGAIPGCIGTWTVSRMATCTASYDDRKQLFNRRSANYKPSSWDLDQVQLLKNQYDGQKYERRSRELKDQVKMMLYQEANVLYYLELIDDLQRLGIFYHFGDEIQSILRRLLEEVSTKATDPRKQDLHATALGFRLLRQHNFDVSQGVFECFMAANGKFDARLTQDTKGLLQLYEASFYLKDNETTLESAREFAGKYLQEKLDNDELKDRWLAELALRALEQPPHWRMLRLEAREFIDLYEKWPGMNPTLLELAKLDFNIVQDTHLKDLIYVSMWWKGTRFAEIFPFSRDRLVENFFWTVGVSFEPQYEYCRRMSTKVNALLTTIDDIYDVYGTLDELELFTKVVQRWDTEAIYQLPDYMKHCYLELYNSINEMARVVMQEQGIHIISHLRESWADICRSYLKEAKWYYSGYVPTLEEYLENAWISIAAPVMLVHAFFFVTNPIKREALKCIRYHNIIRCSAMILRLANDLGTSSDELKRGDVAKSLQCYMNETGASEEKAREYMRFLIGETWKQMNKEVANSEIPFTKTFAGIAMNLARMAQCMYQNGDGHGHQDPITRARIFALLFQPVTLSDIG